MNNPNTYDFADLFQPAGPIGDALVIPRYVHLLVMIEEPAEARGAGVTDERNIVQ